MKLTIEIEGQEESDLEQALAEVTKLVIAGFNSGQDSNDTGKFRYWMSDLPGIAPRPTSRAGSGREDVHPNDMDEEGQPYRSDSPSLEDKHYTGSAGDY